MADRRVSSKLGVSPLDGFVDKMAALKEKKEAMRAKAASKNPVTKAKNAKEALKEKVKAKVTVDCRTLGHKGKRGQHCQRCGSKLL